MVAFGIGVRKAAGGNRRLEIVGALLVALGLMALTVGQLATMSLRGVDQGWLGTMHLVEGAVAMLLIFSAMGLAATAFGAGFRLYTIAAIIVTLGFGMWSSLDVSRVGQGLATPWLGVRERIFWYAYQSWFIVLAIVLLRQKVATR